MTTPTHLYIAIEDLGLTQSQRAVLLSMLRQLGPNADPQPARLCHWRTSLDGDKAIFEAAFDPDTITVQAMTNRLASIYNADPATIAVTITFRTFANRATPIVTFSRDLVDRLRMAVFGGPDATWQESRDETAAYIAANRDDWETDE